MKGFDIEQFHNDLVTAEKAIEVSMGIKTGVLSMFNGMVSAYQVQGVRISLDVCKGAGIATSATQKINESEVNG